MTTLRYEATARRLRIEGGRQMADVADDLVAAAQRARDGGGTVVLLRKHGMSVDNALTNAERAARRQ